MTLRISNIGREIQIEVHAYLNQKKLIELCQQHDMIVTSYGPLGRPGFQKDASEPVLILDPKVIELSEKYGRTPAQIVLRYLVYILSISFEILIRNRRATKRLYKSDFLICTSFPSF